ncbi:unnamed protein product [Paramecium octaurelia]|uniref:Uncharacterized protein n=1 Tax=Paramecium octaurelia TaxID=43137 RepID=A0A8S1YRR8_PAROT|nr:unnamed protein product [Paramecium octaurelia]
MTIQELKRNIRTILLRRRQRRDLSNNSEWSKYIENNRGKRKSIAIREKSQSITKPHEQIRNQLRNISNNSQKKMR